MDLPTELTSHLRDHKLTARNLKPYWQVLAEYLIICMYVISGASLVAREIYGSMFCTPLACANSTKLFPGRCSEYQVSVLDSDYYYELINRKCSDIVVHWFSTYYPYWLLLWTTLLLIFNNFFALSKLSGIHVQRFVDLVNECNETVGKCSDILKTLLSNDKKEYNEQMDKHATREPSTDPYVIGLLSLHERVVTFHETLPKGSKQIKSNQIEPEANTKIYPWPRFFSLVNIYRFQAIIGLCLSIALFLSSSCLLILLDVFRTEYACSWDVFRLEKIMCTYPLHSLYYTFNNVFLTMNAILIYLNAYHSYWVIAVTNRDYRYESGHKKIEEKPNLAKMLEQNQKDTEGENREKRTKRTNGDFELLKQLLNVCDKYYEKRFNLFLCKLEKSKLQEYRLNMDYSLNTLSKLTTKWESGEEKLKLEGMSMVPRNLKWLPSTLTILELMNGELREFPSVVLSLVHLVHLHLNNNHIVTLNKNDIPGEYGKELKECEKYKAHGTRLKCCILTGNSLSSDSRNILKKQWPTTIKVTMDQLPPTQPTVQNGPQNVENRIAERNR